MSTKKKTAAAKAKKGDLSKTPEKLNKVADYLSAQIASPSGPQLATEAGDLKLKRDTYVTAANAATTAHATAAQADLTALSAEGALDISISTYVSRGGTVAAGNAAVLTSLAIDVAAARILHGVGPAPAPTKVALTMGVNSGESKLKWTRPAGAGAFVAQYKLEPATPTSPPTDWLPAEGYSTNKVEWLIQGLPPAAAIRARVRSIGAQIGTWSDEVLGKAR